MQIPSMLFIVDKGTLLTYSVIVSANLLSLCLVDKLVTHEDQKAANGAARNGTKAFPTGQSHVQLGGQIARLRPLWELEGRGFRDIANRIISHLEENRPATWAFASSAGTNSAILDRLSAETKHTLVYNLRSDLANVPHENVLQHFMEPEEQGGA